MALFTSPKIYSRPFQSEVDFWRVRNLLIETYPLTPTGFNWELRRWDGWRFHRESDSVQPEWYDLIHLWETEDGRLVGAVHPEGRGDFQLELHPAYREIEREMIAWAEQHLAADTPDQRQLETFAFDYDTPRRRLLAERDFEVMPYGGVLRRLRFGSLILPAPLVAEGYHLRSTHADLHDCQRIAQLLNAAFNRTIHTAKEYQTFSDGSPSFRHDLNLVVEAPDGSFAAHVGVTFVEANGYGVVEPVCTHPHHRRKGLARALIVEGLHRLKALGAADAYVGTGDDPAANALYEAVGFGEAYTGKIWRKVWPVSAN